MAERKKATNGSGSIFRRADGRWCGALYVTESDGRRVRRRIYGRTRKEVEDKLVELRSKAEAGAPLTPTGLTLGVYLQEWLTQIVAQRVRPNTLAGYRFHVERYLVPDLGGRKLGRLTAREGACISTSSRAVARASEPFVTSTPPSAQPSRTPCPRR